jgi:hypothetical protein
MTYVNPIPADYDLTTISVNTSELATYTATIATAVQNIANNLTDIMNTLNGLSLDWLGDASNQAQTFNNEWGAVVQMLYGAMDGQGNQTIDDGALSVLVGGLDQAIDNYNANEQSVIGLFSGFGANTGANANASTANSVVDSPSDPISNASGIQEYLFHTTAVDENF